MTIMPGDLVCGISFGRLLWAKVRRHVKVKSSSDTANYVLSEQLGPFIHAVVLSVHHDEQNPARSTFIAGPIAFVLANGGRFGYTRCGMCLTLKVSP